MSAVSRDQLQREARPYQRAIDCHVCGGSLFDVLLDPDQVREERSWMETFYRTHTDEAHVKDQSDFTQFEDVFIVVCRGCGTLFRNPQPKPSELSRRYSEDEYGDETLNKLLENEMPFAREKAAGLEQYLPKQATILEVGSFVGAFLESAREREWNAIGLDPGEEPRNFCLRRGLDVRRHNIEDAETEGPFDAVCIWNTFDQLPDPHPLLARAKTLLKPEGILVIRIPNGAFKSASIERRFQDPANADPILTNELFNNTLTFPYLSGYTPESITQLLSHHGFTVETIKGDTILRLTDPKESPDLADLESRTKEQLTRYCDQISTPNSPAHPWLDIVARPTATIPLV